MGQGVCTASDTSGCFFHTCNLNYNWELDTTLNTLKFNGCNKLDCNESSLINNLANFECPIGNSIAGFDDNGQPKCRLLVANSNPCPFGTFLKGYKADGKPDCTAKKTCEAGKFLTDFGFCSDKLQSNPVNRDSCTLVTTLTALKEICNVSYTGTDICRKTEVTSAGRTIVGITRRYIKDGKLKCKYLKRLIITNPNTTQHLLDFFKDD